MYLKDLLQKHKFRFKKSLGQNFISDKNLLKKIVETGEISKKDIVVEIGPGAGTLTKEIASQAKHVLAIEIDKTLLPILRENLSDCNNVTVIQADALKEDLDKLVRKHLGKIKSYKIVANLPYYITTPLIMHCLENNFSISRLVVMVQKEVAERLKAGPSTKEYGAITVAVNLYAEVEMAFVVPREVFVPRPDVDSAILDLKVRKEFPYELENVEFFRKVVKAGFAQRRKTLNNTLKTLGLEKEKVNKALEITGIDPKRRGETLSLEEFSKLSNALYLLKD